MNTRGGQWVLKGEIAGDDNNALNVQRKTDNEGEEGTVQLKEL